jgi:hypothetical protein
VSGKNSLLSVVLLSAQLLGCASRPAQVPEGDPLGPVEVHGLDPERITLPAGGSRGPRLQSGAPDTADTELPRDTVVLHVGSSSAGALGPELNRLLEAEGIKAVLKFKQSTYIPQWAGHKMGLARYLAKYNPDLVIVSLGGNETEIPDPTVRVDAIRRLVKLIGDRPCVWVGTPRWKVLQHTGILEVVEENAAPCKFIDSDELAPDMKPLRDGIHPTVPERRRWARRVLEWLTLNRDEHGKQPWSFKPITEMPAEEQPPAEE